MAEDADFAIVDNCESTETVATETNSKSLDSKQEIGPLTPDKEQSPTEELTGYALVADLMRRQDEVIQELTLLDQRVEAMIDQLAAEREARKQKQELAAASAATIQPRQEMAISRSKTPNDSSPHSGSEAQKKPSQETRKAA